LIQDAIKEYFNRNGKKYPECIFFFRDGVGEGQIATVLNTEVTQILNGFKLIDEKYNPKFAEILITKRINDRIFATGNLGDNRQRNQQGGK